MHRQTLKKWQHSHDFVHIHKHGERLTLYVVILTAITMVVEVVAGLIFGSMALLADGWHMSTHVAAFGITIFAYRYARKHANSPEFSFGTGKVNVLGGFASAIALVVVAFMMALESTERIFIPQEIHFNEAIAVAILGLIVNIVSALILQSHHTHSHEHHHHHHHDHNLRAAYFHVLADALTSLLAIMALFSGKLFGWEWMDPIMGIVGAVIITHWAYGLLKETSSILLDKQVEQEKLLAIKTAIEADSDNRLSDLHVWQVGPSHFAVIISLVTHDPKPPEYYKKLLNQIEGLSHISVEVNRCADEPCI
jgi:cation diffusion facilitator family transporter